MTHGSNVLVLGKDIFRQTPEAREGSVNRKYHIFILFPTPPSTTLGRYFLGHRMVCSASSCSHHGDRATLRLMMIVALRRAMNAVVRSDIVVSRFLNSVGGYRHKERRDKLLDILDVDLDWSVQASSFLSFVETKFKNRHMHTISDGERRRVQLTMGLMQPWDILLLDEVGDI